MTHGTLPDPSQSCCDDAEPARHGVVATMTTRGMPLTPPPIRPSPQHTRISERKGASRECKGGARLSKPLDVGRRRVASLGRQVDLRHAIAHVMRASHASHPALTMLGSFFSHLRDARCVKAPIPTSVHRTWAGSLRQTVGQGRRGREGRAGAGEGAGRAARGGRGSGHKTTGRLSGAWRIKRGAVPSASSA